MSEDQDFVDRRVGLIACGVVSALIGLGSFVMAGLTGLGAMFGAAPLRTILPSVVFYFGIGLVDIVLGIGSMQCRRWGYRLMLAWAGTWLAFGLIAFLMSALILPQFMGQVPSQSQRTVMIAVAVTAIGLIYIVLPASFFFFYRTNSVRLTCQIRDPNPSWTESRPLPILIASILFFMAGLMTLPNALLLNQPIPLFGIFVSGWPAILISTALSAIWLALAWGYWNLRVAAWWIAMSLFAVGMISTVITLTPENLLRMYEMMEIPEASLRQIKESGFLKGDSIQWMIALSAIPFLQLYLKRFFRPADSL